MRANPEWKDTDTRWPGGIMFVLLAMLASAYSAGLFPDVMEIDAAQYASISAEMARTGEYLQVKHRHENYLDKPPLLFWLSSISVSLFGNHSWVYKLPSLLATLLGLWSLFRLALIYYSRKVAWNAVFILASCQAWFMFNQDVRTDTLLAAFVLFSVWQFASFITYGSLLGLILGSVGLGLAMLAKGPIAAVVVGTAIAAQLIFSRNRKAALTPLWLLAVVITAAVLAPMTYGLYKQYGMKGPAFFFWTQSFGRITGENEWRNDASFFYFFHTFPWAFLPWFPLALLALWDSGRRMIKNRFHASRSLPEVLSVFGFILPFLALSLSHYKLPHYIFVTFPFAALFSARFLSSAFTKPALSRWTIGLLIAGITTLALIGCLTSLFVFNGFYTWFVLLFFFLLSLMICVYSGRKKIISGEGIVIVGILVAAWTNLQLNLIFYPKLMNYQPGKNAAEFLNTAPAGSFFALYGVSDHPLEFYSDRIFPYYFSSDVSTFFDGNQQNRYLYTDRAGVEDLKRIGYTVTIIREYPRHHPALLSFSFLDPSTRNSSLDYRCWVAATPSR